MQKSFWYRHQHKSPREKLQIERPIRFLRISGVSISLLRHINGYYNDLLYRETEAVFDDCLFYASTQSGVFVSVGSSAQFNKCRKYVSDII
jgi:hypothetical protein